MRAREFIINVPIRIKIGNDQGQDTVPAEDQQPELDNMVPPLQQELELEKRKAGVTNVYDEQKSDTDSIR